MLVDESCLTLCSPMDCSPPGSSVHGILQARILEWVANLFSRGSSQPRDQTWVSCLHADSLPSEIQENLLKCTACKFPTSIQSSIFHSEQHSDVWKWLVSCEQQTSWETCFHRFLYSELSLRRHLYHLCDLTLVSVSDYQMHFLILP